MKSFSNEIIFKINAEIEASCTDSEVSSDKALYMINFIRPLFEELREFIHQYTFQDANEEISFFKDIKPFILSKLIYFSDIYTLELRKPNGSKEVIKEYYNRLMKNGGKCRRYFLSVSRSGQRKIAKKPVLFL